MPQRSSFLCPSCRKLISIHESVCPHCGLRNPGSRWKQFLLATRFFQEDQFIKGIIYVNVALFVASILLSPTSTELSMNPFGFLSPGNRSLLLLGATGKIPIDQFGRWWTLLSANYLHGGILHLLFNMMALRQIGPLIFQEYGAYRTIAVYTLGGVAGYGISYVAGIPFTFGASGAVCGLIGAALYYGKSRGGHFGQMIYQQVGGWALGIFIFGFLFPGINNWAHGGGLLGGAATGFVMGYQDRNRESAWHRAAGNLCLLASVAAILWGVISSLFIVFA